MSFVKFIDSLVEIKKPNTLQVFKDFSDYADYNMMFPPLVGIAICGLLFTVIVHVFILWPIYILEYPFKKK